MSCRANPLNTAVPAQTGGHRPSFRGHSTYRRGLLFSPWKSCCAKSAQNPRLRHFLGRVRPAPKTPKGGRFFSKYSAQCQLIFMNVISVIKGSMGYDTFEKLYGNRLRAPPRASSASSLQKYHKRIRAEIWIQLFGGGPTNSHRGRTCTHTSCVVWWLHRQPTMPPKKTTPVPIMVSGNGYVHGWCFRYSNL